MEELILELLEEGDRVIFTFNNAHPLKATFVKCSNRCVVLINKMGRLTVIRVDDIVRFQKADPERLPMSDGSFRRQAGAVDSRYYADAESETDSDSEEETSESEAKENVVSLESVVGPTELYELEIPEVAPVKVVGKVNLDEIERKPRRRVTRLDFNDSRADNDFEDEADDDSSPMLPAMGVVTSIGPKFGFIDSEGSNFYFNYGEIIGNGRSKKSLNKGDEVVFTPTTNPQGKVAKAVHHPWSVDRHLHIIEKMMDRDMRNASLLARQLVDAFPDDDTVQNELFAIGMKNY